MAADVAESEQRQRQVRERGEIARGAHRALRRHARHEAGVDQPLEEARQLDARPREALQQARELQHQGEAHHRIVEQRADAAAVREDDVPLQQRALRGRDARLREQPEAGVDAVGGGIGGGEAQGGRVRLTHRGERRRLDADRDRSCVHPPQLGEAQRS